ncbi:MAG TPA: helix-turn-helix domain-containing protein [Solirubrobacteraceae bacterium]|nr:helix-turn-helix domain-containing protein [Solirubrobacteraceae bacterium]
MTQPRRLAADTEGPGQPPALTRRERAKRDKRNRIFRAATDLFARNGFSAVTTEQIAEAADVGTGTLFRYFPTKAELLVAVMSEQLRVGTERGLSQAAAGAPPAEAILALVAPLVEASLEHPENTGVYQRETLFSAGTPQEGAARQVAQLPDAIHRILETHAAAHPVRPDIDLRDAAEAIYATMLMNVVRVTSGRMTAAELPAQLRHSVEFLLSLLR